MSISGFEKKFLFSKKHHQHRQRRRLWRHLELVQFEAKQNNNSAAKFFGAVFWKIWAIYFSKIDFEISSTLYLATSRSWQKTFRACQLVKWKCVAAAAEHLAWLLSLSLKSLGTNLAKTREIWWNQYKSTAHPLWTIGSIGWSNLCEMPNLSCT